MFGDRTASLGWLLALIVIIWIIEIINIFLQHQLNHYGIVPRTIPGLRGILFSPFLHGGMGHVISNTLPLLILGGLVALRGQTNFIGVTGFIIFAGGLGLWAIGRPWPWDDAQSLVHVGASGLVFGYFGYLVARGWYERSLLSILVAAVVIFMFGSGMLFGLLPTTTYVSWEGHLSGLLAGALIARLTRKQFRRPRESQASLQRPDPL